MMPPAFYAKKAEQLLKRAPEQHPDNQKQFVAEAQVYALLAIAAKRKGLFG